jgi:hypothetical protein
MVSRRQKIGAIIAIIIIVIAGGVTFILTQSPCAQPGR